MWSVLCFLAGVLLGCLAAVLPQRLFSASTTKHQQPQRSASRESCLNSIEAVADDAGTAWFELTAADVEELRNQLRAQETCGLAGTWKPMMVKDHPGSYRYTAHRQALPTGMTLYRTVTTCPGITPLELMEFLLDDGARTAWEGFLSSATILQQGAWRGSREQVVRWVRSFPFHFLSDREYVIARRAWGEDGAGRLVGLHAVAPGAPLYAVTRGLDAHPAAPESQSLVRTARFDSRWRCAAVPDPWGGPTPAAEVVLLHTEDIRIPEYLARTAVSLGMAKFVHDLVGGLERFKAWRHGRGVPPHALDPLAYGHDWQQGLGPATAQDDGSHAHHGRTHCATGVEGGEEGAALHDFERLPHAHATSARCDGSGISAAEGLHTHAVKRRRQRHGRPHQHRRNGIVSHPAAAAEAENEEEEGGGPPAFTGQAVKRAVARLMIAMGAGSGAGGAQLQPPTTPGQLTPVAVRSPRSSLPATALPSPPGTPGAAAGLGWTRRGAAVRWVGRVVLPVVACGVGVALLVKGRRSGSEMRRQKAAAPAAGLRGVGDAEAA